MTALFLFSYMEKTEAKVSKLFSWSQPHSACNERDDHEGNRNPRERSLVGGDADGDEDESENEEDGG